MKPYPPARSKPRQLVLFRRSGVHFKFVCAEEEICIFWCVSESLHGLALLLRCARLCASEGAHTNVRQRQAAKGSIVEEGFGDTDLDDDDNKYVGDTVHEHESGNAHEDEDVRW